MNSRRYDAVALVVIALALAALNLFWTGHEVSVNQAAQKREQAAQQAAQARAATLVFTAICRDVGTMAAIAPPAGNPAQNPSRAYEQAEARAWRGLTAALGCKKGQP